MNAIIMLSIIKSRFCSIADKSTIVFNNCTDGELRLIGGTNATLGAVQGCMNNAWGSVCNDGFSTNDATVVCRQLGFPITGAEAFRDASTRFNISTGPVFLDRVDCRGSESSVMNCRQTTPGLSECTATEIAGVQCIGMYNTIISLLSIFCSSDMDQCLTNNGGCSHTCTNELPGFTCSCRTGFTLDTDNKGCFGEQKLPVNIPANRYNYIQILTSVLAVPVETSVSTLMAVFIASVPPTLLWILMAEVAYVRSCMVAIMWLAIITDGHCLAK